MFLTDGWPSLGVSGHRSPKYCLSLPPGDRLVTQVTEQDLALSAQTPAYPYIRPPGQEMDFFFLSYLSPCSKSSFYSHIVLYRSHIGSIWFNIIS